MTKDDIITLPNPRLRQQSEKVTVIDDNIQKIIAAMKAATLDWEASRNHEVGVALAAIQIDQLYRIIVVRDNAEDKNSRYFHVFINPEITKFEGEIINDYEGCLSIKYIYGRVPRYAKVRAKALDENGQEFRVKASGFLARVLQHEIDHTNGKLFIDHINSKPDAFFRLNQTGQLDAMDYEREIKDNPDLWA